MVAAAMPYENAERPGEQKELVMKHANTYHDMSIRGFLPSLLFLWYTCHAKDIYKRVIATIYDIHYIVSTRGRRRHMATYGIHAMLFLFAIQRLLEKVEGRIQTHRADGRNSILPR